MGTVIVLVMVVYFIFFIYGFVSYAFNSYGLYELARAEDEPKAILAWIPYINKYILGKIAFESTAQGVILASLGLISAIFALITLFISSSEMALYICSAISLILSLILAIYTFVARYKVYKKYSKSTILMTVFDVISLGILGPFFIFAIKHNDKVEQEKE